MTDHEGIVASVNPKLAESKPELTSLEKFTQDTIKIHAIVTIAAVLIACIVTVLIYADVIDGWML